MKTIISIDSDSLRGMIPAQTQLLECIFDGAEEAANYQIKIFLATDMPGCRQAWPWQRIARTTLNHGNIDQKTSN